MSSCSRYVYHLGLIDYLQKYNFAKKFEHFVKTKVLLKGEGISASPPGTYAKRFMRSMRDRVILTDFD